MSIPDGPSAPTHIPPELQDRYGAEARQRVLAARQRDRQAQRAWQPKRWQQLALVLLVAALAGLLGLFATSWLVGGVMFAVLSLLGLTIRGFLIAVHESGRK